MYDFIVYISALISWLHVACVRVPNIPTARELEIYTHAYIYVKYQIHKCVCNPKTHESAGARVSETAICA